MVRTIIATAIACTAAAHPCCFAQDDPAALQRAAMERFRAIMEKSDEAIADFELTDDEISELKELGISDVNLESLHERARYGFPQYKEIGRGHVSLHLRDPISTDDLDILIETLNLSEGQQKFLDEQFLEYVVGARKLWEELARPLWKVAADLVDMNRQTNGYLVLLEETKEKTNSVERRFRAFDDAFLESLRPILSDSQQPLLDRAKLSRERATPCTPMFEASRIDLAAIHRELMAEDRPAFAPVDAEGFERTLIEHERRMTVMLREYITRSDKLAFAAVRYSLATDNTREHAYELFEQAGQSRVALDRKMHDDVLRTAAQIGEYLSPRAKRLWSTRIRHEAYPVLYLPMDDPSGDLLIAWLNDEEGDDTFESTEALRALLIQHDTRIAAANRRMEEPHIGWCMKLNAGGYSVIEYWPYQEELIARMRGRMNVLRSTLKSMASLVPNRADVVADVIAKIDATEESLSEVKGDPNGTGWPGPTHGYRWYLQNLESERRNAERRKQMEEAARRRREQQNNAGDDDGPS